MVLRNTVHIDIYSRLFQNCTCSLGTKHGMKIVWTIGLIASKCFSMIPPSIVKYLSVCWLMSLLWRSRRKRPLARKNRGPLTKKKCLKALHAWHTAHTAHAGDTRETALLQYSRGETSTEIEKDTPKNRLDVSTASRCPRKSHYGSSRVVVSVAACGMDV